jgi:hypothetical protein
VSKDGGGTGSADRRDVKKVCQARPTPHESARREEREGMQPCLRINQTPPAALLVFLLRLVGRRDTVSQPVKIFRKKIAWSASQQGSTRTLYIEFGEELSREGPRIYFEVLAVEGAHVHQKTWCMHNAEIKKQKPFDFDRQGGRVWSTRTRVLRRDSDAG